ncbi:MAG: methyltransferase domain-containing protein [Candidatus Eisenbacteria bacterium]|nr:methyltransferase domain-containing protein [Candidatus Eisenbacteria bacterium]
MPASEVSAYSQAVDSGLYARVTGLRGKYDHVRVFWEDQAARAFLRPHLQPMVDERIRRNRDLRLLDLGCGGGDGIETLFSLCRAGAGFDGDDVRLIPRDRLERYTGIDINPGLLDQARRRHQSEAQAVFLQADLRRGLPFGAGEPPYDVYFTSYGTLSHFDDASLARLLCDVVRHAEPGALVVGDWLGRYAYEWTTLWDADCSREQWMDYRISYIYSREERQGREIQSFPLRLLCPEEILRVTARVEEATGRRLILKTFFDRSLFVGRHMETGDYNPRAIPLRSRVNSLHQPLQRTDLGALLFELDLPDGYPRPSETLRSANASWNALVRYTREALRRFEGEPAQAGEAPEDAPEPAQPLLKRMARVIQAARWLDPDDARSEFVEPQLGLALRDLEQAAQSGRACGHSLIGVFEIRDA